jgi:hypothetical protein
MYLIRNPTWNMDLKSKLEVRDTVAYCELTRTTLTDYLGLANLADMPHLSVCLQVLLKVEGHFCQART